MPVSLLLQLSDLVFASDSVIGGNTLYYGCIPIDSVNLRKNRCASVTVTCRRRQVLCHTTYLRFWSLGILNILKLESFMDIEVLMMMVRVIPLDLAMNLHKAAVDAGKTNIKMQVWHCMWTIVCLCYSARRDMLDPQTSLDPIFFPIPFFMTKKAWIHKRVPGGRKVQIISQICAGPCLQWHFLHFEQCGRVSNHTIHWLFINFRCLQQKEDWAMERYTVPKNYQHY